MLAGVGGVFCIFAQFFSVGYGIRVEVTVKVAYLTLAHTDPACSAVPGSTVLHCARVSLQGYQLYILHSIVRSLSEGRNLGKELSDEKDMRL